jgi:DNA-binding MarR family transcriptional regulator
VLVGAPSMEEDKGAVRITGGGAKKMFHSINPQGVGKLVAVATTLEEPMSVSSGQLDLDELAAWRGMLRIHAHMTQELDAELTRRHRLPLSSYEVLLYLADAPGGRMRMSDLAESVLLSRSGLTRLVDRLERDGLLQRERCEDDARGYFATITKRGRALFDEARKTHLAGVRERFVSRLSRKDLRTLAELWEKVEPGAAY